MLFIDGFFKEAYGFFILKKPAILNIQIKAL